MMERTQPPLPERAASLGVRRQHHNPTNPQKKKRERKDWRKEGIGTHFCTIFGLGHVVYECRICCNEGRVTGRRTANRRDDQVCPKRLHDMIRPCYKELAKRCRASLQDGKSMYIGIENRANSLTRRSEELERIQDPSDACHLWQLQ
jgi:hypothetical protein